MLFGNVLYYPGCVTKFYLKEIKENYEKIFSKFVDFIELPNMNCCGSPVLNAGYEKDFEDLKNKNIEVLKKHKVKEIITNCPACFYTFKQVYKIENEKIKIEHATTKILEAIKEKKIKIKKMLNEEVTYHDPCYLGRYSKIYEEPRGILKAIGCEILEMDFNRENSYCCGGGGGLQANFTRISLEISKERIKQALETKANFLVTACPQCYIVLKRALESINNKDFKIFEISQLIIKSL
ncbi:MAG: (Fe-S)-binding protein [Candidatus Micrarchaeia archaeon]